MFKFIVVTFLMLSTAFTFFTYVGEVEGNLFPVISNITLSEPQRSPENKYAYTWEGSAYKYRECSPVDVFWYLGKRGYDRVRVNVEFRDKPQIRPMGHTSWEDITIDLSPQELYFNSHADVTHDCGQPWLVKTRFYDSKEKT